jgi:hypothetical protein
MMPLSAMAIGARQRRSRSSRSISARSGMSTLKGFGSVVYALSLKWRSRP